MNPYYSRLKITFLFFIISSPILCQTVQFDFRTSSISVCTGSEFAIPFITTGVFPSDNEFKVQISSFYGNAYQDIGKSSATSPIKITIPSTFALDTYFVRLVSTKNSVISNLYTIYLNVQPTGEITVNSPRLSNINPYDQLPLNILTTGGGPWQIILNDSTKFTIPGSSNSGYNNISVSPLTTTTYSIASITNACGAGISKNSMKIGVNSQGFKVVGYYTNEACIGNKLSINYSLSESLPKNTEFLVDFIDQYQQNSSVTIPITGNTGPLIFIIPEFLPPANYLVKLRSKDNTLEALLPNSINIRPRPYAKLTGLSSINLGQIANLDLTTSVYGFLSLKLSDGTNWVDENLGIYSKRIVYTLPEKTTNFTIISGFSSCGAIEASGNSMITVNHNPVIDSLSKNLICAGETIKVFISTALSTTSNYQLALTPTFNLPAVVDKDGGLKVQIPFEFIPELAVSKLSPRIVVDNVIGGLNDYISLAINYPPQLTLKSNGSLLIDIPEPISIELTGYQGIGSYEVELSDGSIIRGLGRGNFGNFVTDYVFPTSAVNNYSIKSVRNYCGYGVGKGSFTVIVKNQNLNKIYLQPLKFLCQTENVPITFTSSAKFEPDNVFTIEVSDPNGNFNNPIQTISKSLVALVNLPKEIGIYNIRVTSSKPIIRSNQVTYIVSTKPKPIISVQPLQHNSYRYTSENVISIPRSSIVRNSLTYGFGLFSYQLSDGTSNSSESSGNYPYRKIKENTKIQIKYIIDECGRVVKDTVTFNINVFDFEIKTLAPIYPQTLCVNSAIQIPFTVKGSVPDSTTYYVQLSSDGVSYIDVPSTYDGGLLRMMLPETFDMSKNYFVRVVAKFPNGNFLYGISFPESGGELLKFKSRPMGGTLLSKVGTSEVSIESGQTTVLKLNYSGTNSMNTILNDGIFYNLGFDKEIIVSPIKTTTYEIKLIYNDCGYGTPNGKVKVTVKPIIKNVALSASSFCAGSVISLNYETQGEFGPVNLFKFYLRFYNSSTMIGPRIEIGQSSLLNGSVKLQIPDIFSIGFYQIEMEATDPTITKIIGIYLLNTKPSAVLSGNLFTYPNQLVNLRLKILGGGLYSFKLNNITFNNYSSSNDLIQINAPTETTTFKITDLRNGCGEGFASGSALVTILSNTNKIIPNINASQVCAGLTLPVDFSSNISFQSGNKFTVQLSDSSGINYKDILTEGVNSPLQATIPVNTPPGNNYRFRIVSTQPAIESISTSSPINILPALIGTLSTPTPVIAKGDTASLKIDFTGTGPWFVAISSIYGIIQGTTNNNPVIIRIKPDTTTNYRLNLVSNSVCGVGVSQGTVSVTVSLVTATEPIGWPIDVTIYPNPTDGDLIIRYRRPIHTNATMRVLNLIGQEVISYQKISSDVHLLQLQYLPNGIYVLELELDGEKASYRIVKQ